MIYTYKIHYKKGEEANCFGIEYSNPFDAIKQAKVLFLSRFSHLKVGSSEVFVKCVETGEVIFKRGFILSEE